MKIWHKFAAPVALRIVPVPVLLSSAALSDRPPAAVLLSDRDRLRCCCRIVPVLDRPAVAVITGAVNADFKRRTKTPLYGVSRFGR